MKISAILLAGSVAANAALLTLFAYKPALAPAPLQNFFGRASIPDAGAVAAEAARRVAATARATTARAEAARGQLWSTLDTEDLRALVARLRASGFTPAVIRAIVGAKIELRFRSRMKELVGTVNDAPFWKADGMNGLNNTAFFESYNQIYRERSRLMREVLGDEYMSANAGEATAAQQQQYGNLSKAKIDLIARINDDYSEMAGQVRAATQGIMLPEDRAKLALLEQEKRADLAAILSPQELEDYLMRSSPITMRLRGALSMMDATEAEFRAIYAIHQPFAEQLFPGGAGGVIMYTSSDMNQRREAQKTVTEQIKAALGEERANEFVRASNSEFQQLYRLTQREGLPVDAAVRAFDLRNSTAEASMKIYNDRSLTPDQMLTQLQTLAQTTRIQLVGALGATAGALYGKSSWLTYIERGGAVSFSPEGGTSYRSINRSVPPGRN